MVDVYCTPIDAWTGPKTANRERSPFTVTAARAMRELERELDLLGASECHQIRMDGWPKAGANPPPPVVVTFEARVGSLRFQCDRFNDWHANLRAIGLTLQRLRLVDEGGVARGGEQYAGWNALPATATPTMAMGAGMTDDEAARLLKEWARIEGPSDVGWIREHLNEVYRDAAKRAHPDQGGDEQVFKLLTAARDQLGAGSA
jgi:hypothetical protein